MATFFKKVYIVDVFLVNACILVAGIEIDIPTKDKLNEIKTNENRI